MQQEQELNITELIESSPITRLSSAYNSKMLTKIKENFSGFGQQLFVSSFYCYLNYDKNKDFVVDLDNVWRWLGFQQKVTAKTLLELQFKMDVDYKNGSSSSELGSAQATMCAKIENRGGHNKQTIMLTVRCFKSLCLKAQTKKAGEIHEYYMKMEETLHEVVEEETDELRKQLEQLKQSSEEEKQSLNNEKQSLNIKSQLLDKEHQQLKKASGRAIEQATIVQFPLNTECIYFGTIGNTNMANERLIKFGHTNDLATRVLDHRKKYDDFVLEVAFRVQNKVEIENLIKTHPRIKRQIRSIEVAGKAKTEIIAYDSDHFTMNKLTKYIKEIIHSKTYSVDNFNRIMKENEELHEAMRAYVEEIKGLKEQLNTKTMEYDEAVTTNSKQQVLIDSVTHDDSAHTEEQMQMVYHNPLLLDNELTQKFNEFINTMCVLHPEIEESSGNMEGQFRIWCKTKPKKETFHALKNYLDTRFKQTRLSKQSEGHMVCGYVGVRLNTLEYKKRFGNNNAENFAFQVCTFSPTGKMLNTALLSEYQKWKRSLNKPCTENDIVELKEYLNSSDYVVKAVVWVSGETNEGYYGISLRSTDYKPKYASTTGKKVEKVTIATGIVFGTWDTIAKAAAAENMSAAKMSRSIKYEVTFQDDYMYRVQM